MFNKKLWSLFFVLLIFTLFDLKTVKASEYNGFKEVMMESGKLLENYTDAEYETYYKEVCHRKFFGWNVYVVNKNVKANYIKSTDLELFNDGKETNTYEVNVTTESQTKTVLGCSGDIKYDIKGNIKKFSNNLSAKIGIDFKEENLSSNKRTEKINIKVDEKTKLLVTTEGSALVTNGVASYYAFWFQTTLGGFEYFTIIQEFNKIEKVKI